MIKINLLEIAKGKGKRGGGGGPSMPTMEMGDMGSPKLKILVVVDPRGTCSTWATGTGLTIRERRSPPRWKRPSRRTGNWRDVKARYPGAADAGQQLQAARRCDRRLARRVRPGRSTCWPCWARR